MVFRNKSRKRQKLEQKRLKLEAAKTERTKKEIEIHMLGFDKSRHFTPPCINFDTDKTRIDS